MKSFTKIAAIIFFVFLLFVQKIYANNEKTEGYRWLLPGNDSRAIYSIDFDKTGLGNGFTDFSATSKLNNWTLSGQIKKVFVLCFPNGLSDHFAMNNSNKSEILKSCKKLPLDSSSIDAFIYTYSSDGRLIEKFKIHLANRDFSETESKEIIINGIPFTGYSYIDSARTIYTYNKYNLVERISNDNEFEIRKYDDHNNLLSREGGFTLDAYKTKSTQYKIEYKYSPGKIEVFTTSSFDIYPIKTKDVFLDSNLNIATMINYDDFSRDTSDIISFTYDNTFRIKKINVHAPNLVHPDFPDKILIYPQYRTEYTYNSIGKLKEEIIYGDGEIDSKTEYKYDNSGLLTERLHYSSPDTDNGNWNSNINTQNIYLSADKMNNPTQIIDITGVMQFDKNFNYEMGEIHFITYEYYK